MKVTEFSFRTKGLMGKRIADFIRSESPCRMVRDEALDDWSSCRAA